MDYNRRYLRFFFFCCHNHEQISYVLDGVPFYSIRFRIRVGFSSPSSLSRLFGVGHPFCLNFHSTRSTALSTGHPRIILKRIRPSHLWFISIAVLIAREFSLLATRPKIRLKTDKFSLVLSTIDATPLVYLLVLYPVPYRHYIRPPTIIFIFVSLPMFRTTQYLMTL